MPTRKRAFFIFVEEIMRAERRAEDFCAGLLFAFLDHIFKFVRDVTCGSNFVLAAHLAGSARQRLGKMSGRAAMVVGAAAVGGIGYYMMGELHCGTCLIFGFRHRVGRGSRMEGGMKGVLKKFALRILWSQNCRAFLQQPGRVSASQPQRSVSFLPAVQVRARSYA